MPPDIRTASHQDIFDYVLNFLRKQGVASVTTDRGQCSYRGDQGHMCAFGCLIPDEQYNPRFEGFLSSLVIPMLFGEEHNLSDETVQLIRHLQSAHDRSMPRFPYSDTKDWEHAMERISTNLGLNYACPR